MYPPPTTSHPGTNVHGPLIRARPCHRTRDTAVDKDPAPGLERDEQGNRGDNYRLLCVTKEISMMTRKNGVGGEWPY